MKIVRRPPLLFDTWRDIVQSFRTVRRRPGYSAAVVLTLGLGIGASASVFSVVDGVVFRPLPYEAPERLVTVWETYPRWRGRDVLDDFWDSIGLAWPDFVTWREQQRSFDHVAVFTTGEVTLTEVGDAVRLDAGFVSSSFFATLGVGPELGRLFLPNEDGPDAPAVAVLSDGVWRERFGGQGGALGRTIRLDGRLFTVAGVLPPEFRFPAAGEEPGIWIPAGALGESLSEGNHTYTGIARLGGGAGLAEASRETAALLRGERPPEELGARLEPHRETVLSSARPPLLLLLAAAGVLLLIACVNVIALMLNEASARAHEIATRASLGATRGRIARQFMVESLFLSLLAAGVGALAAVAGTRSLVALAPLGTPRLDQVAVDGRVLLFATLVGALAGLVCGALPGLSVARARALEALRYGGSQTDPRGRRRAQSFVIAVETAVLMMLLTTAGLLGRSLLRATAVEPGIRAEGVLTALVEPPASAYPERVRVEAFFGSLVDRLAAIPGVEQASGISVAPFTGQRSSNSVGVEGRPDSEPNPEAEGRVVLPSYFRTIGIPLVSGRDLDEFQGGQRPMVVNETMARRLWPGESAVGRRVTLRDTIFNVVGVVGDVRDLGLTALPEPTFYVPLWAARDQQRSMRLVLRVAGEPIRAAPVIRRAVAELDSALPVSEIATMDELVGRSLSAERYRTILLSAFAWLSVFLAATGVFGVTMRLVRRRRREFGVRLALGAAPARLVRGVLAQTTAAIGAGLGIGAIATLLITPALGRFLYDVSPHDPTSHVVAALVLASFGIAATWIPARRAASVDPARVLRSE